MAFTPLITSGRDALYLRRGVEGALTGDDSTPLKRRMAALNKVNKAAGVAVTFGSEIEFEFSINPLAESTAARNGIITEEDIDRLRPELVYQTARNAFPNVDPYLYPRADKGKMYLPTRVPLIMNQRDEAHNYEGHDDSIIEMRTAPAEAPEAIRRYWRLIWAIGKTARQNGLMASLLSTHTSIGAVEDFNTQEEYFTNFWEEGAQLPLIFRNLVTLQPFQLDAGIEDGWVVLEAFPDKSAFATVHRNRIEVRHPAVGVCDPRVTALGALGAYVSTNGRNEVARTSEQSHDCRALLFRGSIDDRQQRMLRVLACMAKEDVVTGKLVIPAQIDKSSVTGFLAESYNELSRYITGEEGDVFSDNAERLREALSSVKITKNPNEFSRIYDSSAVIDRCSPYARGLGILLNGIVIDRTEQRRRVEPEIYYDSPELHLERRRTIKLSPRVRRLFGSSLKSVISGPESVRRRSELVEAQMIEMP